MEPWIRVAVSPWGLSTPYSIRILRRSQAGPEDYSRVFDLQARLLLLVLRFHVQASNINAAGVPTELCLADLIRLQGDRIGRGEGATKSMKPFFLSPKSSSSRNWVSL